MAERRTKAFELWCWRRLLRVPWTARRSNQSILKKINHEYSLEGLMLKLKLQYFNHLMQRADSLKKTLMLEEIEAGRKAGERGWDGWIASSTQWTWDWANSGRQWRTGKPGFLQSMGLQRVRHNLGTEQQKQVERWKLSKDMVVLNISWMKWSLLNYFSRIQLKCIERSPL